MAREERDLDHTFNFATGGLPADGASEHRINYGRIYPGKTFKADCTCGWSSEGDREFVIASVRRHEDGNL